VHPTSVNEPAERIPPSVHVALVAVQLMFASLSIVGKQALHEMPAFALICARVSAATLVMLVAWLAGGREKVERRDWPELALYAFFGVTANMLIFILGLSRTTATNAVVIGATIPVFTVGVALVLRREAATVGKLVGLGVACLGALTIVGAGRFQSGGDRLVGNLLVVLNSLSFSIYLVISRRLLAKYRPLTVVTWTFVFGTLGVLPFGALPLIHAAPSLSAATWWRIAYIVVSPTVGTYFLNMYALRRAPASLVAIYIYVQPIVGALMAAVTLDERPSADTFIGGAFIGTGIWLVSREARRLRLAQLRAPART
jgi:drug/metabolite transporter (DMT)-like permease